jgi:hypothetical protein
MCIAEGAARHRSLASRIFPGTRRACGFASPEDGMTVEQRFAVYDILK